MDPPSLNVDNHRRGPPLTVQTNQRTSGRPSESVTQLYRHTHMLRL